MSAKFRVKFRGGMATLHEPDERVIEADFINWNDGSDMVTFWQSGVEKGAGNLLCLIPKFCILAIECESNT